MSPKDFRDQLALQACFKNNAVNFLISPQKEDSTPFAVEICVNLTNIDGTVESRVKKEHVFRDKSPWTFLDSLEKKEFVEKEISLFLRFKIISNLIQSLYWVNMDYSCVGIEPNSKICFSEIEPPVTSSKDSVAVVTKDSGSQTSNVTSDMPDDSVAVVTKDSGSQTSNVTSDMPDDSVAVVTKDSGSQTSNVTSDMPDDSVLSKDLMYLYQDQDFSDINIKCHNVSFPVHRNILGARSPVFKTMLSTDMTEAASGLVNIGDLDPSTLGLFLTYLYTGAVEDLESDRALKLYYAADKYQVPSLKDECSKFLCDNVSLSNVCDVLSLADRHQDDQIMSVAHDFILDNFNAVLKSEEWGTLKKNEPILVAETLTQFAVEDRVARKHHLQ